jgi:hypothetical protein
MWRRGMPVKKDTRREVNENVPLVVVLTVGPNSHVGAALGTLESALQHTDPGAAIIVADGSGRGAGRRFQAKVPRIQVVGSPEAAESNPYITLAQGLAYAVERYRFDALLRLDPDALILRARPEAEAIRLFREQPAVGIAGQCPRGYAGNPNEYIREREQALNADLRVANRLRNPAARALHRLYRQAAAHGYTPTENIFGSAYFLSEDCVRRLRDAGLLPNQRLQGLRVPPDHLMGLLVKAVGKEVGALPGERGPFACPWQILAETSTPAVLPAGKAASPAHPVPVAAGTDTIALARRPAHHRA